VAGRIMLRASQAELIPAREGDFAASVAGYDDELHKLAEGMRAKTRELAKLQDDESYKQTTNPDYPRAPPPRVADVPYLNFAELDNAVAKLEQSAIAFDKEYARLGAANDAAGGAERERVNSTLAILEQNLTDSHGLPGREWYQHMIYAPGLHTGYGVKTLPGIREAIEERRWEEANQYIGVVSRALNNYSARMDRAIAAP
jgi:N-acetylated-alpha-linked acidic dipeptidase